MLSKQAALEKIAIANWGLLIMSSHANLQENDKNKESANKNSGSPEIKQKNIRYLITISHSRGSATGKHRPFIFGLMAVLVFSIIIINAMRTNAAPAATILEIEVVQQENLLKASVEPGQDVVAWRAVRQSHNHCMEDSFALLLEEKKLAEFELSYADHDQYYCFRAQDNTDTYAFQSSPQIDLSGVALAIEITTRQLDDIL